MSVWGVARAVIYGALTVAELGVEAVPRVKRLWRAIRGEAPVAPGPGLKYRDVAHIQAQIRAATRPPHDAQDPDLPVRPRTPPR